MGLVKEPPLGIGAGVVCSVASLAARERPVPGAAEELRSRKSVARKNLPGEERRGPWAWEQGTRFRAGAAEWRALREKCSPRGGVNLGLVKGWITCKMWGFGVMGSIGRLLFLRAVCEDGFIKGTWKKLARK
jgi:hypothetical protein